MDQFSVSASTMLRGSLKASEYRGYDFWISCWNSWVTWTSVWYSVTVLENGWPLLQLKVFLSLVLEDPHHYLQTPAITSCWSVFHGRRHLWEWHKGSLKGRQCSFALTRTCLHPTREQRPRSLPVRRKVTAYGSSLHLLPATFHYQNFSNIQNPGKYFTYTSVCWFWQCGVLHMLGKHSNSELKVQELS